MASERVLDSAPSLLPLFARSATGLIPGSSRLPFLGGGGHEIPDVALTLPSVSVERERLAAYDRVCGFSLSDTLPATYIHVLAFPLHLALMADRSFPFRPIGLVHIANEITYHRPVDASETLSFRVSPTPIESHPRGRKFSLRTQARVGEEVVWEEVATILKRESGGSGGSAVSGGAGASVGSAAAVDSAAGEGSAAAVGPAAGEGSAAGAGSAAAVGSAAGEGAAEPRAPAAKGDDLPPTATWRLRGDLGRRYAAVSGDINPIHMHALTAKLLGFESAIAHGMWTKARSLAALEGRLPDSFTVAVSFRRPIILPATVAFSEARATAGAGFEGIRFRVSDARKGTPHLDGSVRFG